MDKFHLYSLRLGFSTQQANSIKELGLEKYVFNQLNGKDSIEEPDFIKESPKSIKEFREYMQRVDKGGKEAEKAGLELRKNNIAWKSLILQRSFETEFPLKEKINLFFQNHFVSTLQSVKVPYWIYLHYKTINDFSLGNYKDLIKEMVYSNAVIKYLDNHQNKKGNINENLARELLELFTLGEGHYTENDIKNVALSLSGLSFGETKGEYMPNAMDKSEKTVLGKTGNFDVDDVIDIIMEQENLPYFLSEKVLKWFFYDLPDSDLIKYYGNYLKEKNFELCPFFEHLFITECEKGKSGTQIKNPWIFILQIHHDLNLEPNYPLIAFFLKEQGMDVYEQPNVKGWKGGNDWLTTQIYETRKQLLDFIIFGNVKFQKELNRKLEKLDVDKINWKPQLKFSDNKSAAAILNELLDRMIFESNEEMQTDLDQLLKYDFDVNAESARERILSVYNYLAKCPEFQIV